MKKIDDFLFESQNNILKPFPIKASSENVNQATQLYGLRFYKDQTPVEYLAEFLLVFTSPKEENGEYTNSFIIDNPDKTKTNYSYWPEDKIALKLFAFFPFSKLETRHQIHRKTYLDALEKIKERISGGTDIQKSETIRFIQSLLAGFVGVANNRTWVTHCFLPASKKLLSREIDWKHSRSKDNNIESWEKTKEYFLHDRHNFMGRGGEVLFLQLANLFSSIESVEILNLVDKPEYAHLKAKLYQLNDLVTKGLTDIVENSLGSIDLIIDFLERNLSEYKIFDKPKKAPLGWVPVATKTEALLFASEINNICSLHLGVLEKIDLLQTLCCLHVLRSLCFQAHRFDDQSQQTLGFIGNYAWITSNPKSKPNDAMRKLAESSFNLIEAVLYRVLRHPDLQEKTRKTVKDKFAEADKNGFKIFRKIAKEIGLVIPPTGKGQRFSLNPKLMRFLVAALVQPGEHIRLTDFYHRVFAHYGIALGGEPLAVALAWCGNGQDKQYAIDINTDWVEETLQQGGFLIELSDAVSIVHNPGSSNRDWT